MKMNHKTQIHMPFVVCACLFVTSLFLQSCGNSGMPPQVNPLFEDEDTTPEPSGDPNLEDPFVSYEAVLELREEMQNELERLTKQKELRYSQFLLIEKNLKELSKNHKITREKLESLKQSIKTKIDFVVNYRGKPTLDIKCKTCKRQMGSDYSMLYHLEESENIFGGPWRPVDSYGNPTPNASSYPNLKSFYLAYPDFDACFVSQCVFCYKDNEIERVEKQCNIEKQNLEKDKKEYTAKAEKYNHSSIVQDNLVGKVKIQEKVVVKYEAAVGTFKNLAKDMEKLRKSAIIDYETITYGDTGKYTKGKGEV